MAEACIFLLERYSNSEPINVGSGNEITIRDLASTVAKVIGFNGRITNDHGKPDGMPRKLMESSRINAMGWRARMGLEEGIAKTYEWFLKDKP
jgi:GDP-L-fucose synthase